jgi:nucleoside phosphorylase
MTGKKLVAAHSSKSRYKCRRNCLTWDFRHGLELEKKHTLCAAVHKSKVHGRTLHLLVKEKEVFDVSEDLPVQSTYLKNYDYMTETLKSLLDDKRLCPMCPSAYLDGTAALRFQSHEKVALALALARCLVDFFNEDLELASHTWNPERIFLIRTSQVAKDEHQLYISLRPKSPGLRPTNTPETIQIGDPVLLAFARLLMEINSGEKILFEIHPRREDNITIWAKMCDLLSQLERDRSSFFFEAVKGCLYLHTRLQTLRRQGPAQVSNLDIKKVIYENVVKNLELELNPDSLKRKRSNSDDEDEEEHSVVKKSFKREDGSRKIQQLPAARLSRVASLHNGDSDLTSLANSPPRDRDSFEVAILCALPLEYDAVSLLMDRIWDNDHDLDGRNDNDSNAYMTGRIGRFNVVLVLLSNMGKVGAASSAASLRSSYPKLKFVFLTGICGGVPRPGTDEEILLGDVIISKAAIQYDHGRLYPDGLAGRDEIEDSLGRLPKKIRNLVTVLETDLGREKLEKRTNYFLQQLQSNPFKSRSRRNYQYPGAENDILYKANFRHKHHETSTCICVKCHKSSDPVCEESRKLSCEELGCDEEQTVPRERLNTKRYQELNGQKEEAQAPSIFVGRVGSGDTVVKSGEDRDKIAKRHNLLAFEMEAAGIWDEIPCIVVKGVCDYADSHKNKSWQAFASATAACATKALLERVPR